MAEQDMADLIVAERFDKHIKKAFAEDQARTKFLRDNFTLPPTIPKPPDMTDSQLDAIARSLGNKYITLDSLAKLLRDDISVIDLERQSRK